MTNAFTPKRIVVAGLILRKPSGWFHEKWASAAKNKYIKKQMTHLKRLLIQGVPVFSAYIWGGDLGGLNEQKIVWAHMG